MATSSSSPGDEQGELKVHWPYKHLWNVLRGESILADDEVILEELRDSYDMISQALTQFPQREDGEEGVQDKAEGDLISNEKKLRRRVASLLNLKEGDASWNIFCTYIMFEYKGGSTSFEKLLEGPGNMAVSTDVFGGELVKYYKEERVAVLLVIQAIFGLGSQMDHKYNPIFQTFREWISTQPQGIPTLITNLLLSLDLALSPDEEVHVLHALTAFLYHSPLEGTLSFCQNFKSFKPGRKDRKLLMAEASLIFTLMNFPQWQELEEDVPQEQRKGVERLLEEYGDDLLLMNKYNLGAVLGGYFGTCMGNLKVKGIVGHGKHNFQETFETMVDLARNYAQDNPENNRNNLPNLVLKGILYSLRTLAEGFGETKVFRCGGRDRFYELVGVLMSEGEVAAILCSDEGSVLQWMVSTAMSDFPLRLKHMTGIWGKLCRANKKMENQCIPLLKDCCKMVTTICEQIPSNSDEIKAILELSVNQEGFRLLEPRLVCGVELPPGTELEKMEEDEGEEEVTTLYWKLPNEMVLDVFLLINETLLIPLATQLQNGPLINTPFQELVSWVYEDSENVQSVLKFLLEYSENANAITESLNRMFEPMAFILYKTVGFIPQWKVKSKLCSQLIDLVIAANKFRVSSRSRSRSSLEESESCGEEVQNWSQIYFTEIWPMRSDSLSLTSQIIMGYESVASNDCLVTIALLKSTESLLKELDGPLEEGGPSSNSIQEKIVLNAVDFVNENVFHSFTRWRFSNVEAKYQILLHCLKVYSGVFDVKKASENWRTLKDTCAKSLLSPNSSLMTILSSSEDVLQTCILQPTRDNYLIPEIIYRGLALLLKLFHFQKESINLVDESLGSTLVQKLGRFVRHRMDYKVPTLATNLLKKIAEEMLSMSMLSCFGSEEVAFRDLISQRLEFRSEDVNLKISILDFLTVAAYTQPGLIQYLFTDDFLAQKIVDLPAERDQGLALAALCFLRALFKKGALVLKKCQNLWENVFHPLNQLQPGGRLKILTVTLNIASIELFRFGMANSRFGTQVKALLKMENLMHLFQMVFGGSEESKKCVLAFKHFVSVLLHRNDMEELFTDEVKKGMLELVTAKYWGKRGEGTGALEDSQHAKVMLDLMGQLLGSLPDSEYAEEYFQGFTGNLGRSFVGDPVPVQNSILTLAYICLKKVPKDKVTSQGLEPIVRVVANVFENAWRIFKHMGESEEWVGPLIGLSSGIVLMIIKGVEAKEWKKLFHHYSIGQVVVQAAHEGIDKCRKEEIIMELLYILLKMAEVKECAETLCSGLMVHKIFLLVMRNAERLALSEKSKDTPPTAKDLEAKSKSSRIYLVTLQLMTEMLRTEGIYFVEHSLNLWGNHGPYIIEQLNSLPAVTTEYRVNQGEYNYRMMKDLLVFDVHALDAVTAMIPFWKHWTLNNTQDHLEVLGAVYTVMQTSVNLLDQPQYLHAFIGYPHPPQGGLGGGLLGGGLGKKETDTRPMNHLLELQSRLWDIIHSSTHMFWFLRGWSDDAVDSSKLVCVSNQIAQACLRILSRPERRRSHSSGGGGGGEGSSHRLSHPHSSSHSHHVTTNTGRIMDTLEIAVSLYHHHGQKLLGYEGLTDKQKKGLVREMGADVGTICDGTRRIQSTHPSLLLERLCQSLESIFNIPPALDVSSVQRISGTPNNPTPLVQDLIRRTILTNNGESPKTVGSSLLITNVKRSHPIFQLLAETPKSSPKKWKDTS